MRYRPLLVTAAFVLAADALTKTIAVALSQWMPIHLPGGWALQIKHNYGVTGGGGAGTALPAVATGVIVASFAWVLFATRHQGNPVLVAGIGLWVGAAVGNWGEHWLFGSVVDWIRPPHLHMWFDVADVAAVSGLVLVLAFLLARVCRYGTAALAPRAVRQP